MEAPIAAFPRYPLYSSPRSKSTTPHLTQTDWSLVDCYSPASRKGGAYSASAVRNCASSRAI